MTAFMHRKNTCISLFALFCFVSTACSHKTDMASVAEVSFSTQVQPIIISNCTRSGCHVEGNHQGPGGFSLTTYDQVMNKISAGDAHGSELYKAITDYKGRQMPPDGFLSEQNIQTIYLWIQQGAKNN